MDTLNVIDVHACIQGEGRYAGVPHILIRTTGCNLNCMFKHSICDTAYASWNPEKGNKSWNDIENILEGYPQIKSTFITGGEPTIHPLMISDIVELLKQYKHFVAMETNGTRYVDIPDLDFVTMSPKLSSSIPKLDAPIDDGGVGYVKPGQYVSRERVEKHKEKRLNLPVLSAMMNRYDYQFKFVYTDSVQDAEEIMFLVDHLDIPSNKVYIMPEGITNEMMQLSRPGAIEFALKNGFNYSDRLHIVAYGNTRIS